MIKTRCAARDRESGLTLVELAVSITVFVVIAVAVAMALTRGMEHRQLSFESYLAINALRDMIAEVQETANLPQDLVNQEGIGAIYDKYHQKTFTIAGLPSATITVTCFPDETAVPAVLGGPQDLNFDGDAQDNLGNQSNGTDLKLVPIQLTMAIGQGNTRQTMVVNRLITKTTD